MKPLVLFVNIDLDIFRTFFVSFFKIGRTPYTGMDNSDIHLLLKSGYRLEKPEMCSEDVYVINGIFILNGIISHHMSLQHITSLRIFNIQYCIILHFALRHFFSTDGSFEFSTKFFLYLFWVEAALQLRGSTAPQLQYIYRIRYLSL